MSGAAAPGRRAFTLEVTLPLDRPRWFRPALTVPFSKCTSGGTRAPLFTARLHASLDKTPIGMTLGWIGRAEGATPPAPQIA